LFIIIDMIVIVAIAIFIFVVDLCLI